MSERTLITKNQAYDELLRQLGSELIRPECVTPPTGIATGWEQLDQFLSWRGLPRGALTAMVSEAGGATTLWLRSANTVTQSGGWAAWVSHHDFYLTPWCIKQAGIDLSRLLFVGQARDAKQLLWSLQELMSLNLFDLIGCNLGSLQLREHQLLKLKKIAFRHKTAVVLFCSRPQVSSVFSLILHFQKQQVLLARALHRPTPFTLERRALYADTLPRLTSGRYALCG